MVCLSFRPSICHFVHFSFPEQNSKTVQCFSTILYICINQVEVPSAIIANLKVLFLSVSVETSLRWGVFLFQRRTLKPFNIFPPNFTDVLIRPCTGATCYFEHFEFVIFSVSMETSLQSSGFGFRSRALKPSTIFHQNLQMY